MDLDFEQPIDEVEAKIEDLTKLNADPNGGIAFDEDFFVEWPSPHRPHQVRLEGGDCSSDSYCYP